MKSPENGPEINPVYPYPLRASSLVEMPAALEPREPLRLTEMEKTELMSFESTLYAELKEIKDIKIDTHEIYPDGLKTGVSAAMVEIMYKQGAALNSWVNEVFVDIGIFEEKEDKDEEVDADNSDVTVEEKDDKKAERKKLQRDIREAVFEDLFEDKTIKSGKEIVFKKLSKIVSEKKGSNVELKRTLVFDENEKNADEIVETFKDFDPLTIPRSWRLRIHWFTNEWAKESMREDFLRQEGDVKEVKNLRKVCRLTDPEKCFDRLSKLRIMKRDIMDQEKNFGKNDDELSKAKNIVLSIYRKYINVQIVNGELLRMGAGENGKDVLSIDTSKMERFDRFLNGVGEEYDIVGNRELLTEKITGIVADIETFKEFEKSPDVEITSDDQIRITNWTIKLCGFSEWKAKMRKSPGGKIGVNLKSHIIYFPKSVRNDVASFLATVAHETEGHIGSHLNWKNVILPLRIMRYYSAGGRDGVLSEAAGKKVEKETRRAIDGFEDRPEVNYYKGMKLRLEGGTFKDCLKLFFENRVASDGETMESVMKDEIKYKKIFNAAYGNASRLFREHTPLDDTSGRLTTTDQLKYLEQETVVKALEEKGLDAVLYVNGPDLYSLMDLIRLGAFDLERIQKPKMVVANMIWPILKEGLARGLTVKQILDEAGVAK